MAISYTLNKPATEEAGRHIDARRVRERKGKATALSPIFRVFECSGNGCRVFLPLILTQSEALENP